MNENNKNYDHEFTNDENNESTTNDTNTSEPMTQEEFSEEYQKLPIWQHMILVLLFLFGMAAIIVGIDFIVDFFTELLKRIF